MFNRIPVLMYHAIEPEGSERLSDEERFYAISPERFREQMRYLKENGYNTLGFEGLVNVAEGDDLPDKSVMITFDDGHISHYDKALPILRELGLKAAFFLVVNDIAKPYRINWQQARDINRAGMDIGSHSMNHVVLNGFSYQRLIAELKSSQVVLEDELDTKIIAYSVPRGLYSGNISAVARGAGYKLVFTSFTGNVSFFSNPYCLRRSAILNHYSMKEFISIMKKEMGFIVRKRLEELAKNMLQKVIGLRGYEKLKRVVFSRAVQ